MMLIPAHPPCIHGLQSCRPLSGAVICRAGRGRHRHSKASIVPPPFGSGYPPDARRAFLLLGMLQSCRPLSGAVMTVAKVDGTSLRRASIVPPPFGSGYPDHPAGIPENPALQSCRPLSGAVIVGVRAGFANGCDGFNRAAPFRERLSGVLGCPPVSAKGFNRAAPFRERLSSHSVLMLRRYGCFNRAAPFRERLWDTRRRIAPLDFVALQSCRPLSGAVIRQPGLPRRMANAASIVPPPFGSGYWRRKGLTCCWHLPLQSCRPLSGAVIWGTRLPPGLRQRLQSCRPLSGAVISPGI